MEVFHDVEGGTQNRAVLTQAHNPGDWHSRALQSGQDLVFSVDSMSRCQDVAVRLLAQHILGVPCLQRREESGVCHCSGMCTG